jgi:hypothetical protein
MCARGESQKCLCASKSRTDGQTMPWSENRKNVHQANELGHVSMAHNIICTVLVHAERQMCVFPKIVVLRMAMSVRTE